MASSTTATQRFLLAGGFMFAVAAGPAAIMLYNPNQSAPKVACPANEAENDASGACKPVTDQSPSTVNPINPEKNPLQVGAITSARDGSVGQLPEVDGIPCNGNHGGGGSTGECIGLQQNQNLVPTVTLTPNPPLPVH